MDPSSWVKDPNINGVAVQTNSCLVIGICSSNSFGVIPHTHHDLVSANSIELNAGASLSDDSGVPLTNNSSISSGDSFQLGMCKYEIEMVESDGEVSQFDSLDNCSEGGMSTENFNTLKKGPIAPIDPPPEFQDSPQTTLVRSMSNKIVHAIRRWSLSQSSFEQIKEISENVIHDANSSFSGIDTIKYGNNRTIKDSYFVNKHLYSSDSILNTYTDNIYDEPNNIISTSLETSLDVIDSDASSPVPPPRAHTNIKQPVCPFYQDHTRYFKAIPSDLDNIPIASQKFNIASFSEIHEYDLYYATRSTYHQYDNSLQRKLLLSPLNHTYHYHGHHYHTGINACANRPISRNSLNSRLSSSHNSLGVSSANKADDSIFITQAMSHDALLSREISDFYNVPIDSDIYAFPIDMVKSEKVSDGIKAVSINNKDIKRTVHSNDALINNYKYRHQKTIHKNNRNKRKKKTNNHLNNIDERLTHQMQTSPKNEVTISSKSISNEPLHMTLEEVKQFYHTLYSDTKDISDDRSTHVKSIEIISSNETIWSFSSRRSKKNAKIIKKENTTKHSFTAKTAVVNKNNNKINSYNDNVNNNNNNVSITNHNNHHQISQVSNRPFFDNDLQNQQTTHANKLQQQHLTSSNKIAIQTDKKSQFTLNLKQKFCNMFRFRKSHNRCRDNSTDSDEYISNAVHASNQSQTSEDKRNKFQSRALPPLPKKAITTQQVCLEKVDKKPEFQSFHFTSSIEKVKDYGWYWGPLSSEAAEKVLSNEPDGSFIVRDSSDDHYIFSLSFKLNNCVRHVRIEQDQGTFSFGSYAKFKSQTITEFIEKAVEHSRSGRYLFFLHRRPEHGPMRVQLTNPVSRFKHVQSLQHMCRFVILKAVIRKDLIQTLPLPRRLLDYLNYKHCFSEQIESDSSHSQISGDRSI